MGQQHSTMRRRRPRLLAVALGAVIVGVAVVVPGAAARADTITVPFQDHLGCIDPTGYAATSSPVFSKAGGSGTIADGATMPFDSAVSAYPMQPGTFDAVTNPAGSFGYGSFGQEGYGSTSYYSGANGIGFSSISTGSAGTLTVSMPFAQRVQFTVGGLDAPSAVRISGVGADGVAVPAQTTAKSNTPGAATAQTVGDGARIVGATAFPTAIDSSPEKAADVWFDAPVAQIVVRVAGDGPAAPADGGFLLTPPLGCQSGTVTAAPGTASVTDVQATSTGPTATYTVPLTTSVANTAPADGMALLPTVRSDLAARLAELGGSLVAVDLGSSSTDACRVPADVVTTGHLLGSTAALAPGADCTQTATATVTLPLAADARTVTTTLTLASSADDTYSRIKDTTTAALTFPGVRSALTVGTSGTTETIPTRTVTRSFTVTSTGPDAAYRSAVSLDAPDGFPATQCSVSGLTEQPGCDALLGGTAVDLGTLAGGSVRTVTLRGVVPAGTPAGTTWPVSATVSSPSSPTGSQTATGTLRVVPLNGVVFSAPAAGATIDETRPVIRGQQAVEGAQVTVRRGAAVVCTATAGRGGAWACTPTTPFGSGAVRIAAVQSFGGLTSDPVELAFRVETATATSPPPAGASGGPGGSSPSPAPAVGPPATRPDSAAPPAAAPGASAPSSAPSAAAGPGAADSGSGVGPGDGPLGMELRFATQRIMPGTAADMRGTLGPNGSGATVAITFTGRMSPGMVYRVVSVVVDGRSIPCEVATTTFSCLVPLDPGQQADVDLRVFADAVNAPDTAVQQFSVASNRSGQANGMTVTTAVAKGSTEVAGLAPQITTFNVTEFPGAMVPLLAMILFALAASVTVRRTRAAGADATPASSPTPPDQPGSTP